MINVIAVDLFGRYDAEFKSIISALNQRLSFRGYWYVQLKRDSFGNLKLLEICTRFAGSFAFSKGLGVNLPLLSLLDFAGLPADVVKNDYHLEVDKTYIDRYSPCIDYDTVYIDYDDTITTNDGENVNPYVIAYLYQCKNKGKKIVLLTRHADTFKESIYIDFDKKRLSKQLFDEIIELSWNDNKCNHIESSNSIFIDNSFAERKVVKDSCGIPVFDVINIDCLFDWRE